MYVLVYVVGCKSYNHLSLNVFHMTSRFARARSLFIHPSIANKCATIPLSKLNELQSMMALFVFICIVFTSTRIYLHIVYERLQASRHLRLRHVLSFVKLIHIQLQILSHVNSFK